MAKTKVVQKPKVSVQDRVAALARIHGAYIDEEIDKFVAAGHKGNFNAKNYLKGNEVSGAVARKLAEFYKFNLEELQRIVSNEDPELVEAYSIGKREAKRYLDFMLAIVEACNKVVDVAKGNRKPRSRKVIPLTKVVEKLKYQKAFEPLGITSLSPTAIIGTNEAWFYDTEKRKLVLYRALDIDGLGVKGTTILNYDEKTSGMKNIRKPEQFFKEVGAGFRAYTRAWTLIRGVTAPVKSRTNDNMIILAVN